MSYLDNHLRGRNERQCDDQQKPEHTMLTTLIRTLKAKYVVGGGGGQLDAKE